MRYTITIHYNYQRESELWITEQEDLERFIKRGCRVVVHDTEKDTLTHYTNCKYYEGK